MAVRKQNGGARAGAGRPKGSRNRRSAEAIAEVAKKYPDWTPLLHMAEVANDADLPPEVRLDAAKSAAPYMHARAKPIELHPDALVELEGRIVKARVTAAAEVARDDSLAERLLRAEQRITVVTGIDRAPDQPIEATAYHASVEAEKAEAALATTPAPIAPSAPAPSPEPAPVEYQPVLPRVAPEPMAWLETQDFVETNYDPLND